MKKAIKFFYKYVDILMVVCLLSVGYSSWSIPVLGTASTNLWFQSYPVIPSELYLELGDVKCFDFCEKGFIVSTTDNPSSVNNGKAEYGEGGILTVNEGSIIIPITINSACYASNSPFSGRNMEIEFDIYFTSSGNDNFLNYCKSSMEVYCSIENGSAFADNGKSGEIIKLEGKEPYVNVIQSLSLNYDSVSGTDKANNPGSLDITIDFEVSNTNGKSLEYIFGLLEGVNISIQTKVNYAIITDVSTS